MSQFEWYQTLYLMIVLYIVLIKRTQIFTCSIHLGRLCCQYFVIETAFCNICWDLVFPTCQICLLFVFQKLFQQEKQNNEYANTAMRKLLHQCEVLHNRLQECNINLVDEDKLVINPSSSTTAFDLQTSDNRISLLLSEVVFCPFSPVY